MLKFTKKNIEALIMNENKCLSFNKKDLVLKEDKNTYVEPTSTYGSSSLASDLSKAKAENPNDDEFVVDGNSYNSNNNDNAITLDVQGDNATDAAKNFNMMQQNPYVKNLKNKNFRFHLESLRRNSIPFSKKEINEMLLN